ncbi:unnamed protein product [Callosobruchus maculatus]|nr:unnamed protein product [Callosobruchus maculatus]
MGGLISYTNNVIDIPAGGRRVSYQAIRPIKINSVSNVIDISRRRRKQQKYPNRILTQPVGLPPITLRGPEDEAFDTDFLQFPKYKLEKNIQVSDKKCTRSKATFFSLAKRQAICKPRDAIFELVDGGALTDDGALVSPRYVVLQRCQGLCKNKSCTALQTVNRTIFVTVKTSDGRQFCKLVQVHDDKTCGCSCSKTCSSNKKLDKGLCKCLCADKMNLMRQCLLKNATSGMHVWNSNECRCRCIEESICSTGSEWNHDQCACVKSWK